jgi:hypothetical protein
MSLFNNKSFSYPAPIPTVYTVTAHGRRLYIIGTHHDVFKDKGKETHRINTAFKKFIPTICPKTVYFESNPQDYFDRVDLQNEDEQRLRASVDYRIYKEIKKLKKQPIFKALDRESKQFYRARIHHVFCMPVIAPLTGNFMDKHPEVTQYLGWFFGAFCRCLEMGFVAMSCIVLSHFISLPLALLGGLATFMLFNLIGLALNKSVAHYSGYSDDSINARHYLRTLRWIPYRPWAQFIENLFFLMGHRNKYWVQQHIIPNLTKKTTVPLEDSPNPCLFVFGADHLRSAHHKNGVLDLLEQQGFKVEPQLFKI